MQVAFLSAFLALAASVSAAPTLAAPAPNPLAPYQPSSALAATWTSQGCYADQYPNARILNGGYTEDKAGMTIEKCLTFCDSKSKVFAGIEYGYQCFCGNTIDNSGVKTAAAETLDTNNGGCNTPAAGNKLQKAGDANHLLLFKSTRVPATQPATVSGSTYIGCYADSEQKRLLPVGYYGIQQNTIESCIARCSAAGLGLASLEYSTECHCGSSSITLPAKASDSKCAMVCSGNKQQLCGGASYQAIYKAPAPAPATPSPGPSPSPAPSPAPSSPRNPSPVDAGNDKFYSYVGCFKDFADRRVLPHLVGTSAQRTNTGCIKTCAKSGYMYASTQNGNECRCGNVVSRPTPVDACKKPCTGISSEYCGGADYAQSLYTLNSSASFAT